MGQMDLFVDPIIEFRKELGAMKLEELSPMQVWEWLGKWKGKIR
jgi:hypothetical protein